MGRGAIQQASMNDGPPPMPSAVDPADSRVPVPASGAVEPPAFGRFRLHRKLGAGSYGEVWQAHDEFLDEAVALKFLNEAFTGDAASLEGLKKEVRTLRRLSHPNIVNVHDLVYDVGHTAIVMEYIDGRTLAEILAVESKGCLEPRDIDLWLPQLGSVFDYLHRSEGVIHSDIKPQNLMLTSAGRLKVADFGLAVTLQSSSAHHTKMGARPGTIAFMSPQQLRGSRPAVSDDIYALGSTLFFLLTGTTPFHGHTLDLLDRDKRAPTIGHRRYESGKRGLAPVPAHWESAIAACLAKDAAQRPHSVRDVVKWLRGAEDPRASAIGTSVILPPAGVKPMQSPGWDPLPAVRPTASQPLRPELPPPPIARNTTWLWILLLALGLVLLAALLYAAIKII
jgi:serine/threonine protein kinase